jgi:hypothetical protein
MLEVIRTTNKALKKRPTHPLPPPRLFGGGVVVVLVLLLLGVGSLIYSLAGTPDDVAPPRLLALRGSLGKIERSAIIG